jgi:hypothetical protein
MIFFLFFGLFVVRLNSGAQQSTFNAISRGCHQLLLFAVRRPWRMTKILNLCILLGRRMAKGL